MKEKKLVPNKRFKEFVNKWEERRIEELAEVRTGKAFSSLDFNDEGEYLVITNKNIQDQEKGIRLKGDKIDIENESIITDYQLNGTNVLITMDGVNIGTTGKFSHEKSVLAQRVGRLNSDQINFIYQVTKRRNFALEMKRLSVGNAIKHISLKQIAEYSILAPNLKKEQQKIGDFFKHFDQMISLEQRKLEKIKALKSAYLAEMFPAEGERIPKRRFTGFAEDWEERSFFDNIRRTIDFRGRTPKKLGLSWSDTGYLALSALNVKNGYIDFHTNGHYGNQELYDKWMTGSELKKGQVLFTTEAPMGNVAQVPDNRGYILSQRTISFDVDPKKITNDFLATLLRSDRTFMTLSILSSGGTAKGVSQRSLEQLKVLVPKELKEQQAIGDFFKKLDKSITNQQQKLNKLKAMKQAYLEEMFV